MVKKRYNISRLVLGKLTKDQYFLSRIAFNDGTHVVFHWFFIDVSFKSNRTGKMKCVILRTILFSNSEKFSSRNHSICHDQFSGMVSEDFALDQ